jgi:PPE-repeat protein
MRMYRRIGVAAMIGVTALGLAACGPGGAAATGGSGGSGTASGQTAVDVAADLSPEAQALAALGFEPGGIEPAGYPAEASPDPSPSASAGTDKERAKPGWRKRHLNRVLLRRNILHGEAVVQTKDGTKTILVQRGQVTAIDDTTMTVKSSDGYTQTWTFGDPIRVFERRNTVQPKDVAVGTQVGVAGTKDGDTSTAKLIVIPAK